MPEKLTGNTRHRMGWFRHMILQVEMTGCSFSDGAFGPEYVYWRDATINDFDTSTGLVNVPERTP